MIEALFAIVILLAIINIIIAVKKRVEINIKPQLKDLETSILRFDTILEKTDRAIKDELQRNRGESNESAKSNRQELSDSLKSFETTFTGNTKYLNDLIKYNFTDFSKQHDNVNQRAIDTLRDIKDTIEKHLRDIRSDNTRQLDEMRKVVDEKLQGTLEKRLSEAFKQVSERLEQVHQGLGEMQNIAAGVGDLKKVLSNVKTRGVLGEYQLENILEQILTPDQYAKNVATKKSSHAHVEFAIKLPGEEAGKEVWIPVDAKFPIEDYHTLNDAYNEGEHANIKSARNILVKKIESFAKDINEKYLDPPHTTDFGIMFLPIEGLYAEVLRHPGLFEILQRKYKIIITGPTTLSAFLNSLQMGFRTLAIQKRSGEVWDILKAVKHEFKSFSDILEKVQKQLATASGTLEKLRTTRTNALERKLKDIETFNAIESQETLLLPENDLNGHDDVK